MYKHTYVQERNNDSDLMEQQYECINTQSVHFKVVWSPRVSRKEGNVLFNDALNTFYLQLYGKGPFR